ncbi:peptidylprolyl isomerase [Saccharicrinis aurantiacus]|uniref:peptidylprolyl isomerase n=1 Tax=Saccharicrinis aurantiacus TaxID=1849719 RepID=UPI0024934A46|nr:peptidylprolyl isomerase [Saccharicrinis aurantiacus]
MATLERIRNKGGILVAFMIGFALLAFILTDFFAGKGGNQPQSMEIGEVNNSTISYNAYQRELSQAEDFNKLRTGQSSVDENTRYQLREQAWNQMVQDIVMGEKYESLGIDVTTDEVLDLATGTNVHPAISQMFTDPQTGVFNQAAVVNFLRNRKADPNANFYWEYLKKVIVSEKLFAKYSNLVKKGLYITDAQINSEAAAKQRSVDFDFVAIKYNTIADSTLNISSSDIKTYYNKNKEDFKQDAERGIEYVTFTVNPSQEDKDMAEKWITDTKTEFAAESTDPVQFIAMNSDIPYTDINSKLENVEIVLKDFAKDGEKGDVYGPYFENNTYKLSRIVDVKMLADSVKARHILIQEQNPTEANKIADSLMTIINKGGDFAALARKNSKDTGSAVNGGDLNWFTEGQMVKPFNDACFNGKKGDVVKVETQFGVHIINIQAVGKKVKKYNIATLGREVKYSSKTYQQVYSEANKFAANNNTADKFTAAIKEQNLTPRFATLKANDKDVSGLENSRPLIQWAFEASVNDMSPTIYEFGNQFVIAAVTEAKEDGYASVSDEDVVRNIKRIVAKDKKAEKIIAKFNKEAASSQSLSSVAQKMNSNVQSANNINFGSFQVPGAGVEPALVALASVSEVNAISSAVQGNDAVYIVKVTSETIAENPDVSTTKLQLTQGNGYKVDYQLMQSLVDEAKITDERAKFF